MYGHLTLWTIYGQYMEIYNLGFISGVSTCFDHKPDWSLVDFKSYISYIHIEMIMTHHGKPCKTALLSWNCICKHKKTDAFKRESTRAGDWEKLIIPSSNAISPRAVVNHEVSPYLSPSSGNYRRLPKIENKITQPMELRQIPWRFNISRNPWILLQEVHPSSLSSLDPVELVLNIDVSSAKLEILVRF